MLATSKRCTASFHSVNLVAIAVQPTNSLSSNLFANRIGADQAANTLSGSSLLLRIDLPLGSS